MTTYLNPRPQPMHLVLVDGSERDVPAFGMVQLEQPVRHAEVLAGTTPTHQEDGPDAA